MPGIPYGVLKYWLEKPLNVEGPTLSKMETGRLRMKYLFLHGAIENLKKSSVHAILSISGGVDLRRK